MSDKHELVDYALDTLLIDEGARKQQEVEQEKEKDKGNSEDEDKGPQQEMNVIALVVMAKRAGRSLRPANQRQSLPNLDLSLGPSHNKARSRSQSGGDSDNKLNSTDLAKDDEKKPCLAKQKQLSSSHDGLTQKKRRRPL